MSATTKKAVILGFGVLYNGKPDHTDLGWLRTGSREVHGIKTYPTFDEAMDAILTDPMFPQRVGSYQIVAEYAFFCRNGEECQECLRHEPVPLESIDWKIVRSKAETL